LVIDVQSIDSASIVRRVASIEKTLLLTPFPLV